MPLDINFQFVFTRESVSCIGFGSSAPPLRGETWVLRTGFWEGLRSALDDFGKVLVGFGESFETSVGESSTVEVAEVITYLSYWFAGENCHIWSRGTLVQRPAKSV